MVMASIVGSACGSGASTDASGPGHWAGGNATGAPPPVSGVTSGGTTTPPATTGTTAEVDASAPPPPSDPPPAPDAAVSCSAKGHEVVMLGDSYPALSGELGKHLQELATVAGALAPGDAYRTYYVSGTGMVAGLDPSIPKQFTEAVTADADIQYVVMDGGGNDVLLGNSSCITTQPPPASASCVKTVADAVAAATKLLADMKTAGVKKVLYYFYPHLPTVGKPYVNDTLDYAFPLVKAVCDEAPIPCTFVDSRPLFEGHPEYIGPDGIHPTTEGSDVLASLIWVTMKQACIAQP
jgi:hypothetical protein